MTDPVGLETRLRYRNGYLWQVEDPAGRVSAFERDGRGRLVGVRYPDGSREGYAYDERHLLVAREDERGSRTLYTYGDYGRMEKVQLPDGSERMFRDRSQVGLYEPGSGSLQSPVEGILQSAAYGRARARQDAPAGPAQCREPGAGCAGAGDRVCAGCG